MDLLQRIFAISNKIKTDPSISGGKDILDDDVTIINIGGGVAANGTTITECSSPITGWSIQSYLVPTGKIVVPYRMEMRKVSIVTDKNLKMVMREGVNDKIILAIGKGQTEVVRNYPIGDFAGFTAGQTIKIWITSEAGEELAANGSFTGIEMDAPA